MSKFEVTILSFILNQAFYNMKKFSYMYFAAIILLFVSACSFDEKLNLPSSHEITDKSKLSTKNPLPTEETISLKMALHSKRLVLKSSDFHKAHLSEEHINEIQSWWQSLPHTVQTQVKNNEVSVELISNIVTKDHNLSAHTTDKQIEQTGNALERVIGMPTDITYTVNTTVVEKTNPSAQHIQISKDTIAKTDIVLMQNVAVKLSDFDLDIVAFTAHKTDNEILQTLQYWWTNLPNDLKDKIRNHYVGVELVLKAAENIEYAPLEDIPSTHQVYEKLDLYAQVLNKLIGRYKNKHQQSVPLAIINKEKALPANATHYTLHISLHNTNKTVSITDNLPTL